MITARHRTFGRFWRRSEGTAAVEFAFIASILAILVIGTMEVARILFATSVLEGGLREAARFGITGQELDQDARKALVVDIIKAHGAGVVNITDGDVKASSYDNFSAIGQPEPFVDSDDGGPLDNGTYDIGEVYTDVNCNGQWDADQGQPGLGASNEVVLYTVSYDLPMMTGILSPFMGKDGKFPIEASVAVRNEPFSGSTPGCGGGGP